MTKKQWLQVLAVSLSSAVGLFFMIRKLTIPPLPNKVMFSIVGSSSLCQLVFSWLRIREMNKSNIKRFERILDGNN